MNIMYRLLIVLGLIILHYVLIITMIEVFVPVDELFIAYIILFNPQWFRDFLNNMAAKGRA